MGVHKALIFWLFVAITSPLCHGSWGTPGLGQYHIQTDEGPERFFRYQTDSGQYRKEKRLQDGTVIGTDAWIDASGFLRQKDYIADNQGYRILKSKTVFVGKGRSIEEAMKSVKNLPAQAGTLVRHDSRPSVLNYNKPSTYGLYSAPVTSTAVPIRPTYSTTATSLAPSPYLGYDHYPTPKVFIRHHSQPVDDSYYSTFSGPTSTNPSTSTGYTESYSPTTTAAPIHVPSRNYEPPFKDKYSPIAVYPVSSTPSPITISSYGPPIAVYPPSSTISPPVSTISPPYSSTGFSSTSVEYPISTTSSPELSTYPSDDKRYGPVSSTILPPIVVESSTPRPIIPLGSNHVDAQPIYSRPRISSSYSSSPNSYTDRGGPQYNNYLGTGYDPQYSLYDGVSVTNNGFRYFLPRHYHEEDNQDPNRRAGSFGYIDPFGIRRVIYYNTSPEHGFVHRKNNRYVGFNATPYDPRPL